VGGLSASAKVARDNLQAAYDDRSNRQQDAGRAAQRYAVLGAALLSAAAFAAAAFIVQWTIAPRPSTGSSALLWAGEAGLAAALGVAAVIALVAAVDRRRQSAEFLDEMQIVGFERDLMDLSPKERPEECRASRLLARNECQLRHFYQLSRRESSWGLTLGALCMLVGCAIAMAALYVLNRPSQAAEVAKDAAWIGAIGTLFSQAVGAVILKLNGDIGRTVREAYVRLAKANALLLTGVFASRLRQRAGALTPLHTARCHDRRPRVRTAADRRSRDAGRVEPIGRLPSNDALDTYA
jgi:hypothetical protein